MTKEPVNEQIICDACLAAVAAVYPCEGHCDRAVCCGCLNRRPLANGRTFSVCKICDRRPRAKRKTLGSRLNIPLQVIAVVVYVVLLTGCKSAPRVVDRVQVAPIADSIEATGERIGDQASAIAVETREPATRQRANAISGEVVTLREHTDALREMDKAIADQYAEIAERDKQIEELRSEAAAHERGAYMILVYIGIGAIVAGVIGGALLKRADYAGLGLLVGWPLIALGRFYLHRGGLVDLTTGLGLLAGLVFVGVLAWREYRRRYDEALRRADLARAAVDEQNPTTVRELVAAERSRDPLLDKAYRAIPSTSTGVSP